MLIDYAVLMTIRGILTTMLLLMLLQFYQPAYAQLPQDHAYQVTLRDYLSTISLADVEVALTPVEYNESYFTSDDHVHANWLLMEDYGRKLTVNMDGLRVDASHFVLTNIERDGQVYMRVGRNSGFMDPINTAWWATWDYAGNPHHNSNAVKLRAFVAAAVDMMMADQNLENSSANARSDYVGGYLTRYAYIYYVVKDILPEDVQAAYETGLLKFFDRIETYYPKGSGGGNMEMYQLPGLWYTAEALDSDDLRNRALARALYVLEEIMIGGGYYHKHGGDGIDLSYEGINHHFLAWAALLYDNAEITSYVTKTAALKAGQTLPEPTGHFYGPSNFNTGTAPGQPNDQWSSLQRENAMAMITPESRYLLWTGRSWPDWYKTGVLSVMEMQDDIESAFSRRNDPATTELTWSWVSPLDKAPEIWGAEHWLNGIPIAAVKYPTGFYDEIANLQATNHSDTQVPVLREENFIETYGEAFLVARTDSYGAIIHTGNTVQTWAQGVPGLAGGGLSAYWTAGSGSVILGRSRGTQNTDSDEWEGERGWQSWAVHAISGTNQSGQPFSSARHRFPEVSRHVYSADSAHVTVEGMIGQHDDGRSAPDGAIQGQVNYERTFDVQNSGLTITSSITSDGSDQVSELWEMIPMFLSDTQQDVSDAILEFKIDGEWTPATTSLQANVSAVRTTRFDTAIDVVFAQPRKVKLAPAVWTADKVSSRVQNVMVDLLEQDGPVSMPASSHVQYTIRSAAYYGTGDPSGDGLVTVLDAATVLQYTTHQYLLNEHARSAADVSGDGSISAFDASLILQYVVGLITCLPAESICAAN